MIDPAPFLEYVRLRMGAQARREAGMPPPWTPDPVIASRRFCCVLRDDDYTSRGARRLIEGLPAATRWAAALTFRLYNRVDTLANLEAAGVFGGTQTPYEVRDVLRSMPMVFNTTAYRVTLQGGLWNLPTLASIIVRARRMAAQGWVPRDRAEVAHEQVAGNLGVGPFLAYQVLQDLRWLRGPYLDEDEWCHLGDGAVQGLERLAGEDGTRSLQGGRWGSRQKGREGKDLVKFAQRAPLLAALLAALKVVEPRANMFELEHNLCEYRKWDAISRGEAKGLAWRPRS